MSIATHRVAEVANVMAEIEKGQQLAGHYPSEAALGRAREVLSGDTSIEEARAELRAKYANG